MAHFSSLFWPRAARYLVFPWFLLCLLERRVRVVVVASLVTLSREGIGENIQQPLFAVYQVQLWYN